MYLWSSQSVIILSHVSINVYMHLHMNILIIYELLKVNKIRKFSFIYNGSKVQGNLFWTLTKKTEIFIWPLFILTTGIMHTAALLLCCVADRRWFRLKHHFWKSADPTTFQSVIMMADLYFDFNVRSIHQLFTWNNHYILHKYVM